MSVAARSLELLGSEAHNFDPGGMFFERVTGVNAQVAGVFAWTWVRREELPPQFTLEPRIVPPGWPIDVAL